MQANLSIIVTPPAESFPTTQGTSEKEGRKYELQKPLSRNKTLQNIHETVFHEVLAAEDKETIEKVHTLKSIDETVLSNPKNFFLAMLGLKEEQKR